MLLFAGPALVVVAGTIIYTSANGFFILGILLLALAPTFVWYLGQIPKLRGLGYYGGQA
jgi:hypothetical protein